MKRIWKYILLLLSISVKAQNLVPNPSFEDTVVCPNGANQVVYAKYWKPYRLSPDYFNSCITVNNNFSVPSSLWGYHPAYAEGNAYIGMITYGNSGFPNYREIVGTKLTQPLIIGQKYFVSVWVTLGAGGYFWTWSASNKTGFKLSTTDYDATNNPIPINNFAHYKTDSIIKDSINWVLVSGSFIADSAYEYLAIGNFYDDANTDTIVWGNQSNAPRYLIDNVCLSTDSLLCNIIDGVNTSPDVNSKVIIFPNPNNGTFQFKIAKDISEKTIIIYNSLGEKINCDISFNKNAGTVYMKQANSGIYFLTVKNSYKTLIQPFVLINNN